MSMFASLGAGLLGGIGSFLGAKSANKAAAQQSAAQRQEADDARNRQGFMMFGPQDWQDFQTSMQKPQRVGNLRRGQTDPNQPITDAQARFFGKYGSGMDAMENANQQYSGQMAADEQAQARGTRQLDTLARGGEDAVAAFGNEGETRIKNQMSRGLEAANQQATASLGNLGMNSLVANQQGQNATRFAESGANAITNLRDQGLQRFLGARQNRLTSMFGRVNAADATRQSNTRTRAMLNREPIDQRQALMSGQAFMPYTPLATSAGQSPMGSALGSAGQSLAYFSGANADQLNAGWNRMTMRGY